MVFVHVKNEHEIKDLITIHSHFSQLEIGYMVKVCGMILPVLVFYGLQCKIADSMDIGGCLLDLCLKEFLVALDICNHSNGKILSQIY